MRLTFFAWGNRARLNEKCEELHHLPAPAKNPTLAHLQAKAIFHHFFQATVRKPGASRQGLNINLLDRGSGTTSISPAERPELQDKTVIYYNGHPDVRLPFISLFGIRSLAPRLR